MAGVLVGIGLVMLILGVLGGSNLWLIGVGLAVVMGAGLLQIRIARRAHVSGARRHAGRFRRQPWLYTVSSGCQRTCPSASQR